MLTHRRQEFYVRFKGPVESKTGNLTQQHCANVLQRHSKVASGRSTSSSPTNTPTRVPASDLLTASSIPTSMNCTTHPLSSTTSINSRLHTQLRLRLPRCHQSDLVTNVRHDQHLRSLSSPTPALPQPNRSPQRRSCGAVDARTEKLRCQGQGYVV